MNEKAIRAAAKEIERHKFDPWTDTKAVEIARAAIEAYEAALPVLCQHEPYQGSCAHCGVPFANGRPLPTAPECE